MISDSNIKFEIARRLEVQEKERIKQTRLEKVKEKTSSSSKKCDEGE